MTTIWIALGVVQLFLIGWGMHRIASVLERFERALRMAAIVRRPTDEREGVKDE